MKVFKRIMTIALAVAMLLTAFGTVSFAEGADTELTKLSVICRAKFNADNPLDERDKNLVYQKFEQDLADMGIEIEYELVDDASIATVVQTRMAAQTDLPDMIADAWIGVSETEILSWAENGLLVDIKKIVDQYDEDGSIFKFYEDHTPGVLASVTAPDGGIYWFSYLNAATYVEQDGTPQDFQGNSYTPLIRADWLEKAGIDYKKKMTHDELFDALKAIQDVDANGNNAPDEVIAIGIDAFNNGFARSFGLSTMILADIDPETGKAYNSLYKEEFKDYIAYMQKLYEAGLYDTTALGEGMTTELIADNKASLAYHYASWDSFESTISATDEAVYAPIMLTKNDGTAYTTVDPLFGTYCHYMVTNACENLEAVVRLFDYIYTDEYALLDKFGLEGVSFEYDENGIPQTLYDPNVHPLNWEGNSLFNTVGMIAFPSINTGYSVFKREVPEDYRKLKSEYANWFQDEGGVEAIKETYGSLSLKLALPTTEEMEKTSEIENVLNTYMKELLTDLILGNRSIDDLPAYIEEMESLGLTDYLDIVQARRDRFVEAVGAN